MSLGAVMIDLEGPELTAEEREILRHPAVGGVILFARNYQAPEQIHRLCGEIHELRDPRLLIGVDQEGGRVQRFRDGFTRLPPACWFGELYADNPAQGCRAAEKTGWLMATELGAVGADFSFAPVLDLGTAASQVIGDRAFAGNPQRVVELARAWIKGVHAAGMAAVGKHFPGHGSVAEDSHHALPRDHRTLQEIEMDDLLPFRTLIETGLEAIMPAHVIYDRVDDKPAGFSSYWLRQVLRRRFGFQGVIFSDDLNMAAACVAGGFAQRARVAIDAGCDMVLVCNNRHGALETLECLGQHDDPAAHVRLLRMHGRPILSSREMRLHPVWREAVEVIAAYDASSSLALDL
jgi:beta-N-acetylhexosaminidase